MAGMNRINGLPVEPVRANRHAPEKPGGCYYHLAEVICSDPQNRASLSTR